MIFPYVLLNTQSQVVITPTSNLEGKRFGMWLTPSSLNAEDFFYAYFMTPPYPSFLELILDSAFSISINTAKVKAIADKASNFNIEISIMVAFDMAKESEWSTFTSFLDTLQGVTSIYSIGIDGEHTTYGGSFSNGFGIGDLWTTKQISQPTLTPIFTRAESEVVQRGFEFINYYIRFGTSSFQQALVEIGHTNFPCGNLQGGDQEFTLDWFTEPKFVGLSSGLAEQHPFPDSNHFDQKTIDLVLASAVKKSDAVRHFVALASGLTLKGFTGVSGTMTRELWANKDFRNMIWTSRAYQDYFILSTDVDTLTIRETKTDEYFFKTVSGDRVDLKSKQQSPELTMFRWDNETYMTLSFPYIQSPSLLTANTLTWSNAVLDVNLYPEPPTPRYELGALELEIILKQSVAFTSFSLPFASSGLVFYYQDFLTEDYMAKEGVSRPLDVMGSYAVYHESKSNNEYKTGKAFHLYRPLFIDSLGFSEYGNISIDTATKLLTFYLPVEWLKTARFPVLIDPTFGYTTVGGSTQGLVANKKRSSQDTLSENGDVTNISVYGYTFAGTIDARTGIYDINVNPDALQVTSNPLQWTTTPRWVNYSVTSTSLSADDYWLTYQVSGTGQTKYDAGGNMTQINDTYADGLSDPYGSPLDGTWNRRTSIYANYTVSGEGSQLQKNLTETVNLAEAVAKGIFKYNPESIGFTDVPSLSKGVTIFLAETVTFVDTLVKSIYKAFLESIGVVDNTQATLYSSGGNITIYLNENLGFTDGDLFGGALPERYEEIIESFFPYLLLLIVLPFVFVLMITYNTLAKKKQKQGGDKV